MWSMLIPILIVVASNTVYNICAKSTPADLNPFASLSVTYLVAMLSALFMFRFTSGHKGLVSELSKINWTSFVLGFAIVGLEAGFLLAYRNGWKISTAQLVASLILTGVLLIVGIACYHETLSARQIAGVIVCAVGLVLIAK